ncbi:hypothetical protein KKG83_08135 [Candidatus Micrarchaeota archaeon]|nr:hypothetical protein [Candidatus Micrarchaeota archaeon]MBU2477410.1 hypothetical protein [Candidatus Micrarchaeota archaeon]
MCKQSISGIYPKYKGLILIPSSSADKELAKYGLLLSEIIEVLEQGFDCNRSKRKKDTLEKCVRKGKKQLKAVIVKSYNFSLEEECWLLIHVGIF